MELNSGADFHELTELKENEVMGMVEGQSECQFLRIFSMEMDSLIENYKFYKEEYDKAELKYIDLKDDNKLNGDAVYDYHFNKLIYENLKEEIVRRTVEEHNKTRKVDINDNKAISEGIERHRKTR